MVLVRVVGKFKTGNTAYSESGSSYWIKSQIPMPLSLGEKRAGGPIVGKADLHT